VTIASVSSTSIPLQQVSKVVLTRAIEAGPQ
jgi:hypothetical protein